MFDSSSGAGADLGLQAVRHAVVNSAIRCRYFLPGPLLPAWLQNRWCVEQLAQSRYLIVTGRRPGFEDEHVRSKLINEWSNDLGGNPDDWFADISPG